MGVPRAVGGTLDEHREAGTSADAMQNRQPLYCLCPHWLMSPFYNKSKANGIAQLHRISLLRISRTRAGLSITEYGVRSSRTCSIIWILLAGYERFLESIRLLIALFPPLYISPCLIGSPSWESARNEFGINRLC